MITLAEGGMMKLQQCANHAERMKKKENGMYFGEYLGIYAESYYWENARSKIISQ